MDVTIISEKLQAVNWLFVCSCGCVVLLLREFCGTCHFSYGSYFGE